MKTSLKLSFVVAAMAASVFTAHSQPTIYTNSSGFLSAIASKPSFTTNFVSMGLVGQLLPITNPTNYSANSFSYTVTAPVTYDTGLYGINGAGTTNNGQIPSGSWLQASENVDALTFTNFSYTGLQPGVSGIGGYWFRTDINGDFVSGALVNVVVDYTSGSYTNSFSPVTLSDSFFGILGVADITSVRITGADGNYSTAANVTAVPEPSTYALLGLAAAGMAGHVLRRRRN